MENTSKGMAHSIVEPIKLTYKEFNEEKHKSTRHFKYESGELIKTPFTELINVSKDRGFAKSKPDYWLKTKDGANWSKNCLTGLFPTNDSNIYYGDYNKQTNLILVEYSSSNVLTVYFYDGYPSKVNKQIHSLIKS